MQERTRDSPSHGEASHTPYDTSLERCGRVIFIIKPLASVNGNHRWTDNTQLSLNSDYDRRIANEDGDTHAGYASIAKATIYLLLLLGS